MVKTETQLNLNWNTAFTPINEHAMTKWAVVLCYEVVHGTDSAALLCIVSLLMDGALPFKQRVHSAYTPFKRHIEKS